MRIPIGIGHSQQRTVAADECEVDTPRIDPDRSDRDTFARSSPEPVAQVLVERKYVPIKVTAQRQCLIREAGQFPDTEFPARKHSQNRPAACGAQIERNEMLRVHFR